jgi:magnesium transporter
MIRTTGKISKKAGLAPGTLVHVGERKAESVHITVTDYDEQNYQEKKVPSIEECVPLKTTPTTTWINIDGLHQTEVIEEIGKKFDLHFLMLEDVLNTNQRPKVEDYESCLFVVLKMLSYDEKEGRIHSEQVSLVLGGHYLITFRESVGDIFGPVRDRIKNTKWRIRKLGADYLLYALVDCIVDNYFVVLEKVADKIELLQEQVAADPSQEILQQIHELKREMIFFRKSVWPVRELVNSLLRSESPLMQKTTEIYLRDIYDHAVQIIDTMETYREMISGMLDVYLSSISNKMNSVMKVLTIIATIFIPLTFVAGVYGMNFKYMPELEWRWAYPAIWVVMFAIFIGMMVYFKRKKWL